MNKDEELRREIAYLSNLIASHKHGTQTYKDTSFNSRKYFPQHSTFNRMHRKPAASFAPYKHWKQTNKSNVSSSCDLNANRYTWTQKPIQSGLKSHSHLKHLSKTIKKHPGQKNTPTVSTLPIKKMKQETNPKTLLKKSKSSPSSQTKYKWESRKSNVSPKSRLKTIRSVTPHKVNNIKSPNSLHKPSMIKISTGHAKNFTVSGLKQSKVTVGHRLVSKYKMRRMPVTAKLRSPKMNISRNPYQVLKADPHKHKRITSVRNCVLRKQYKKINNTQNVLKHAELYKFSFLHLPKRHNTIFSSRYKLLKPKLLQTQTRSLKSGNIVLRRKQIQAVPISKPVAHFHSVKQKLACQALHRSIQTARCKGRNKVLRKFCIYYNRFGRCNRGTKCPYTHDPDRVALCTKFLRGTCRIENCPFSHKLSKEKMPVCSFFLRGKCATKDCPYLHVFVGHTAALCKSFATDGYCAKADSCKEKHIRACYEFYETGICKNQDKCKLPHKHKTFKPTSKPRKTLQNENRDVKLEAGFMSFLQQKPVSQPKPLIHDIKPDCSKLRIQPRLGKHRRAAAP